MGGLLDNYTVSFAIGRLEENQPGGIPDIAVLGGSSDFFSKLGITAKPPFSLNSLASTGETDVSSLAGLISKSSKRRAGVTISLNDKSYRLQAIGLGEDILLSLSDPENPNSNFFSEQHDNGSRQLAGLITLDKNLNIKSIDPILELQLGYSRGELDGKAIKSVRQGPEMNKFSGFDAGYTPGPVIYLRKDTSLLWAVEEPVWINALPDELPELKLFIRELAADELLRFRLLEMSSLFTELKARPEKNYSIITHKACMMLKCDIALFNRITPEERKLEIVANANLPDYFPTEDHAEGHVCYERTILERKDPVEIFDLNTTRFKETDSLVKELGLRSYLGFPVILDHKPIGTLCVLGRNPRKFSPEEIQLLGVLAGSIGLEYKRAQLQKDYNQTLKELKAAQEAKSRFLANMSHELRTPLNGILGFTELLHLSENESNRKEMLGMILSSGEHLMGLVNSMFEYASLDSRPVELNEVYFNLKEWGEQVANYIQQKIAGKNLHLISDFEALKEIWVVGDRIKLTQIALNLLSNAVKFTESGSIFFILETNLSDSHNADFRMIVEDTGIGINPEDRELIFEEFRQLDDYLTKRVKGTGIGLSITRKLVDLLNGKIEVESDVGKGSRFIVYLSFKSKPSKPKQKMSGQSQEKELPGVDGKKIRILLAEDNEANQFLIKAITKQSDWDIVVVDDGEKAIEAYRNDEFDIILMDVQMPVMNGYEATKEIRRMEQQKGTHIPIIALTAYAMKSDREQCIEAGMDDYLSKPFKRQEFLQKIEENINKFGHKPGKDE
ncbi:MAG: hypothetical protein Kow00127_00550 [Bacteroidales bacterium]